MTAAGFLRVSHPLAAGPPRRRRAKASCALGCALLVAGLSGCRPSATPVAPVAVERFEGLRLQLGVVDDPPLAEAVRRLGGEFRSDWGAELTVVEQPTAELLTAAAPPAVDLLVIPSQLAGPLAERGWLTPVATTVREGPDLAWADLLANLRDREARWGAEVIAVPLGSPALLCWVREDLLAELGREPPRTWTEYHELAKALLERGGEAGPGWAGALEPLAPGAAGLTLLARAASYAQHPSRYSTLFDIDDMTPLVAGPPFVRALEELTASARLGGREPRRLSNDDVLAALTGGEAGLGLAWARPPSPGASATPPANPAIRAVPLPGARDIYDRDRRGWTPTADRQSRSVPLLGIEGRCLVFVRHGGETAPETPTANAESDRAAAALRLAQWLSAGKWATRISAASHATGPARATHLATLDAWLAPDLRGAAASYAAAVENAHSAGDVLFAPRLPGADRYLAALDAAVTAALAGSQPAQALEAAAAQWQAINSELGVEAQARAYRRSLGLAD